MERKRVIKSAVVREAFAVLGPDARVGQIMAWANSHRKGRLKPADIYAVRSRLRAEATTGVGLADSPDTSTAPEASMEPAKPVPDAAPLVPVAAPLLHSAFTYEDGTVLRTVVRDGVVWFVARDACSILGIQNSRDAVTRLDESEKGVGQIDTPGGTQTVSLINESGLYCLILRSDKPEARRFRLWVTSDVLPAIRTTGRYERHAGHANDFPPPPPETKTTRKPRAIPDVTVSLKRLVKLHGEERVVYALDQMVGRTARVAV